MERKTKIDAEAGKQEMVITREFDLPLELLFRAFTEREIIEEWMSKPYSTTNLVKFEGRKQGAYQLESSDAKGKVVFRANGVIHDFVPNRKIARTFEMDGTPFGVQLELYEFEKLSEGASKLNMHVIYESVDQRDQVLKLPFAQGISMAHDRLQEVAGRLK